MINDEKGEIPCQVDKFGEDKAEIRNVVEKRLCEFAKMVESRRKRNFRKNVLKKKLKNASTRVVKRASFLPFQISVFDTLEVKLADKFVVQCHYLSKLSFKSSCSNCKR